VQSLEACVEGVIGAGLRDIDPLAKVPTSLADVELGLGHFDAAIELIHQAIEAGFRTSLPYRELAAAYALVGKTDEAKTALAEALRFSPKLTVKSLARHAVLAGGLARPAAAISPPALSNVAA
jgi:predicted Zn-dependent protease